ncbi:DUF72 domain-containing protein, partial [Achromobacter ruhlandii]
CRAPRVVLYGRQSVRACAVNWALARRSRVATVIAAGGASAWLDDRGAGFGPARLMRAGTALKSGCGPKVLDAWADRLRTWARGGDPADLPRVDPRKPAGATHPRDVFAFFINGAKERAPAAARAMIERL